MLFRAVAPGRARRWGRVRKQLTERAENIAARELLAELLAEDFEEVILAFQGEVPVGAVADALVGGSVGIAEEAVPWGRLQTRLAAVLPRSFERGIEEGARIGLRFAPPDIAIDPSVVVDAMSNFIATQSTSAITAIERSARRGVRETLDAMLRDGITPTEAAERIGDLVGLDARGARAVENFRIQLGRQFAPTGEALTDQVSELIERQVERFRRRQLRNRGAVIAETEGQAAIQRGERAFWEQADQQGLVDRSTVVKIWKTVEDERVCPICRPLMSPPAAAVPFDSSFASLGFIGLAPPAHPRCRCFLRYRRI